MATFSEWVAGARPRTLPVAVSPVAVATGAAYAIGRAAWLEAALALVVSLSLQIGVNYANDYSDGIRGTDEVRVGPIRLVGQRLAAPRSVKLAAFASFGLAGVVGLVLVVLTGAWWLLVVGALCVVAAWYYTGGSNPYGYRGLGEVFVFVFFGPVATLGSEFVQAGRVTWPGVLGSIGVGALATAILVANNLRDIPTDSVGGKHTLAVRLGDAGTRRLYLGLILVSVLVTAACGAVGAGGAPTALVALLAYPLAVPLVRVLRSGATGRTLIPVLAGTGRFQLVWSLLLALGIAAAPHV
ncbi:MAG: 1,4-dihydroxy-2-naphthoate polyprenyltransferase [Lapillicoccus sp.]